MDIQQTQKLIVELMLATAAGTLVLSFAGRWIGGVWTTMIATLAACLLVYQPLTGVSPFADFKTDLIRRILLAAIPFTACVITVSFRRVPRWVRFAVVVIGPAVMLYWVFLRYDLKMPRVQMLTHQIVPVAAVIVVLWLLIEPLTTRSPGPAVTIVIGFLTGGIALFLMLLSQGSQAGEISPMVAASAGGAMLAAIACVALFNEQMSFARGPVLVWLTLAAALFSFMWFDTNEVPTGDLLLIAAIPVLAWVPEIGPIHRLKLWKRETIRFVLLAIPFGIAVKLAYGQSKAPEEEVRVEPNQSAAPILPRYTPIAKTIIPPTMT